jgi:hypothetical protein
MAGRTYTVLADKLGRGSTGRTKGKEVLVWGKLKDDGTRCHLYTSELEKR